MRGGERTRQYAVRPGPSRILRNRIRTLLEAVAPHPPRLRIRYFRIRIAIGALLETANIDGSTVPYVGSETLMLS